jgi:hypothetical protein
MPANLFTKTDVTLGSSFSRLPNIGFHYHLSTPSSALHGYFRVRPEGCDLIKA